MATTMSMPCSVGLPARGSSPGTPSRCSRSPVRSMVLRCTAPPTTCTPREHHHEVARAGYICVGLRAAARRESLSALRCTRQNSTCGHLFVGSMSTIVLKMLHKLPLLRGNVCPSSAEWWLGQAIRQSTSNKPSRLHRKNQTLDMCALIGGRWPQSARAKRGRSCEWKRVFW